MNFWTLVRAIIVAVLILAFLCKRQMVSASLQ